jgi:hypothetical protein
MDRDWMRHRSKLLFGNLDRLEVADAIARSPSGMVDATSIADALGIATNRVRAQLLVFAEAGLLEAPPRVGQVRFYMRLADPFWDAVTILADSLQRDSF